MTDNAVGTIAKHDRAAQPKLEPLAGGRLLDKHGRIATDLRVSLTDRCSLRCSYCMPPEGLDWLPSASLLTDDEVIRLITIAVRDLGVQQVRFTGGEPLLRKGLARILAATTALRTATGVAPDTALTTNGVGLATSAMALKQAGLHRINVSLDTLDATRYARLTGRDRLGDVIKGLAAAAAAGLSPIKMNTVLLPGVNDDEMLSLVSWALKRGYQPRFIEQMPLGPQDTWQRTTMVTAEDILDVLRSEFTLIPMQSKARGSAPAEIWMVTGAEVPEDFVATVGIIASITKPFCEACNRTRLTADGQLRSCLFSRDETDVRTLLRSGASDLAIAELWRGAMAAKQTTHGVDEGSFVQPDRTMSAIGG